MWVCSVVWVSVCGGSVTGGVSVALVRTPTSDTLVVTFAVVVVVSVKMGGGIGKEVGGIVVVGFMVGMEVGIVCVGEGMGE